MLVLYWFCILLGFLLYKICSGFGRIFLMVHFLLMLLDCSSLQHDLDSLALHFNIILAESYHFVKALVIFHRCTNLLSYGPLILLKFLLLRSCKSVFVCHEVLLFA